MRPFARRSLLAALTALSAGLATAAPVPDEPVSLGAAPVLGGGYYSTGGGITVAVELREIRGRAMLCGVWAESEQLTAYLAHAARRVLARGSIAVNGTRVHHDLRAFAEVSPAASYAGTAAACVRLARSVAPIGSVEIRIPRRRVHFGRGDGGALEIWFMPSTGANPAMDPGSILPADWKSPRTTP